MNQPLGGFEATVLLAIETLGPQRAYGQAIWDKVEELEGREVTSGALYTTLHRLRDKKILMSEKSTPTKERGGKAKTFYSLSSGGQRSLDEYRSRAARMLDSRSAAIA